MERKPLSAGLLPLFSSIDIQKVTKTVVNSNEKVRAIIPQAMAKNAVVVFYTCRAAIIGRRGL